MAEVNQDGMTADADAEVRRSDEVKLAYIRRVKAPKGRPADYAQLAREWPAKIERAFAMKAFENSIHGPEPESNPYALWLRQHRDPNERF